MTKIFTTLTLTLFLATGLAACSPAQQEATSNSPAADQKQGVTTKTGVISVSGNQVTLTPAGGVPEVIESYSIDFSAYDGQTVSVSGQYSGNTLFVSEVQ